MFYPQPPLPSPKGGECWTGWREFFKEANKILSLQTNFPMVPAKNEPFGFHFSKGFRKI